MTSQARLALRNITESDGRRFWAKVEKTESCWLWTAVHYPNSYGQFGFSRGGVSRSVGAHRVAWALVNGEPPEGLVLDHVCRVRGCVNPDHLRLVTNRENILAGISPSAVNAAKVTCSNGHDLSTARITTDGSRSCRDCHRERGRDLIPCPDCGKELTRSSMSNHRRNHPVPRSLIHPRITCGECGMEISVQSAKRHQRRKHAAEASA